MQGVAADTLVTIDDASVVGKLIMKDMVGKSEAEYIFIKKTQAVTFHHKSSVRINDVSSQLTLGYFSRGSS